MGAGTYPALHMTLVNCIRRFPLAEAKGNQ